jgi:hypothetical protein
LLPIFTSLSERVYQLTGLNRDELEAPQITTIIDRLSARFGARLGLDPEVIRRGHSQTIQNLNAIRGRVNGPELTLEGGRFACDLW